MAFSFARVSAVVGLKVEDYDPQKKRWWLRLREKNGKVNEMPCHHKLEAYLDAYIQAAGISADRKGPLFRAALGRTGKLSDRAIGRTDVWYMVRRRAADAGLATAIGCNTFRATGITDYLTNGGRIEIAQRMAGKNVNGGACEGQYAPASFNVRGSPATVARTLAKPRSGATPLFWSSAKTGLSQGARIAIQMDQSGRPLISTMRVD
jgi:hypothetical protein